MIQDNQEFKNMKQIQNFEENIIKTEYSEVMQKSYIDYAMSVIVARALPDVRDGKKEFYYDLLYHDRKVFSSGVV